jgi:hypothetical protein
MENDIVETEIAVAQDAVSTLLLWRVGCQEL